MYCHDILDIYDVESGLEQNDHNWMTALTSKPRVQILPTAHKGSIVDTNVISCPRGYVLVKLSVIGVAMRLVKAAVASHDFHRPILPLSPIHFLLDLYFGLLPREPSVITLRTFHPRIQG